MNNRKTLQRSIILETVKELHCHATADEVYDFIVAKHPNISRGTVYRNLKLLSFMGEIHKVEIPSRADRFDHESYDHYHARCVKCDRVFNVEMEIIPDLAKNIKDTQGFEFTGHDLIFKGICPECNSGKGSKGKTDYDKNPDTEL
jgi:Fur family ferric uptake transcriptional regulator/Fur family peroxide stress response transcriptional regulator